MRIVMFGDGAWATGSLLRLRAAGHEVAAVVLRARPSEPTLEATARSLGLPTFQPARVNAPDCIASVRELAADVHLSIAYNQIFGPILRATAPWFLNVHAGKLPQYRGRNIINWALINGERELGVTVHFVDEGIDTGDILLQRILPIAWTSTYGELLDRVVREVPDLVVESLELIANGHAQLRPQGLGGTYFGGRRDGDEWIDWGRPSFEIYNLIRGISRPGPGARTLRGDERVVIWRARYELDWPRYRATPGEVVGREPGAGVVIKTGDSTLLVQEVQIGTHSPEVPAWPLGTRLGVDQGAVIRALTHRLDALQMQATPPLASSRELT
jgi:methionyl-tRNA formyltransferase